ncbi:MAG: hypothetical protein JW939_02600 [Candidatus Thermoplasmatota archaeon]|nr:hypothetical protein [Candidatus Thermoplasmatota archaeon]
MIRYLLVLYLGLISIVLIDPNPLWATPLLLVLVGFLWEKRSLSLVGMVSFSMISVGHVGTASFSDLPRLLLLSISLVLPMILLLEISLSPRPFRLLRISLVPVLMTAGMIVGFFCILMVLIRVQRIGVYLSSDGLLQVFITMALSIFLTGPVLLGRSGKETDKTLPGHDGQHSTIKTNK